MFEVIYKYYARLENGDYDTQEVKELKRKVGDNFDDISLDEVAAKIMQQFARRDIWVKDVEIYEFKKQKITFRETKGGIIIKNRKFNLDSNSKVISEDLPEETPVLPPRHTSHVLVPQQASANLAVTGKPIRWVSLDDAGLTTDKDGNRVPIMHGVRRLGLKILPGKKYAVYEEKYDPKDKRMDKYGQPSLERKMLYLIEDEAKAQVYAPADYFLPADVQLIADKELKFTEKAKGDIKLKFDGEITDSVPDIRR